MAKHARHKPIPKKWIIGSAVSAGAVLLIVFVVLLVQNGLLQTLAGVFSHPSSSESSEVISDVSSGGDDDDPEPEPEPEPTPEPEPQPEPKPEPEIIDQNELISYGISYGQNRGMIYAPSLPSEVHGYDPPSDFMLWVTSMEEAKAKVRECIDCTVDNILSLEPGTSPSDIRFYVCFNSSNQFVVMYG